MGKPRKRKLLWTDYLRSEVMEAEKNLREFCIEFLGWTNPVISIKVVKRPVTLRKKNKKSNIGNRSGPHKPRK